MSNQIKISRYESIIQSVINDTIINEVNNKIVKFATVTAVRLSSDLSMAKVYLDCLDRNKIENVVFESNKLKGLFRSKIAQKLNTFRTPSLVFVSDESIDYANKIENLFKEINGKKGD